jgi:hypothetical protein
MDEEPKRSVRLFSYHEDQPNEARGTLIPRSLAINEIIAEQTDTDTVRIGVRRFAKITLVPALGVAALALVVFSGYNAATTGQTQVATPAVTVIDPYTARSSQLAYGREDALQAESLFSATNDAFIEAAYSFLSLDLEQRVLRYFENGVLLINEPILNVGAAGSWWETPSGLYEVQAVEARKFSTYAQVYFPHSITFEGNYVVHGRPLLADREPVSDEYTGGGVWVADEVAERLTNIVSAGTPVLVRGEASTDPVDTFVYEERVPDVTANQYLVADINTGTILAANGAEAVVPVASITKLMTAIVAAEQMDLDQRVYQETPTFIESMIPRLGDRRTVSMYSLLQLLLTESSNEAAEVIAREYGRTDFISEMNTKARAIGMFDTTFADPSGLSAANVSSVQDLLTLTEYIYNERSFILEITGTGEAVGVAGGGEFNDLNNFNEIDTPDTFIGGKIGETAAAGMTSVSLHTLNVQGTERTVAVIVLGSSERDADVTKLLAHISARFNE